MTFEEWCVESGYKHPEFGITVSKTGYLLMQSAWNAAIASAINKIETKNNKYYELRIEEVDFNNKTILACAEGAMTDLESDLKKLLTAFNLSATIEV